MNFHGHPRGVRLRKAKVANVEALETAIWLLRRDSMPSERWVSWVDLQPDSPQRGLWVLLNKRTLDTYIGTEEA